jgi:hypothetical protein
METRSTNKGSTWPSISLQYQHNHEEWDENLNNDEVEQVLPQYPKIIFQIENLDEQAFVTEARTISNQGGTQN